MDEKILVDIIQKYDGPTYIFDIDKINQRISFLRSKLPKRVELCYAIKANTFVVKEIENNIDRFEVCSPGEYKICEESNVNSSKILISGVYKSKEFIEELTTKNQQIGYYSIESMEQFKCFKELNKNINILIRITSGNQFGINKEEAEEIIKNHAQYKHLNIIGIQYFSGTQKKSIKNLKRELDYATGFIKEMQEKYNFEIKELEFGPGFPVNYFQNSDFDEEKFLEEFSELINNIDFKGKITLELGRSIASSCGTYITKVVDIKKNKDENYAIVDGGMNHIVYYGQFMAMKHPKCSVYPPRKNENTENWNLCGALCTINDILIKQYPVNNLKLGDFFIFENTGAYCMTEGISLFLSRNLPKVIKVQNGNFKLVREGLPTYKLNM